MAETHSTDNGLNPVMQPSDATGEFVEAVELLHGDAGDISAARVTLEESTAKSITGDHVTMTQSAVKNIEAQTATMTQSAAMSVKSADIALHQSSTGIVSGERVDIFDSMVGVVRGPVTVGEGASARVFVQVGPGNASVRPMLSAQAALGLGAGFGATLVLLSRLLRRLLGN
jgi:hypothetical protein